MRSPEERLGWCLLIIYQQRQYKKIVNNLSAWMRLAPLEFEWLQYLVFLRGIVQTLLHKKGMPTKKEHLSRLTPID